VLLLKTLEIFNSRVLHERTVFYAPHHSHTSIQWKQNKKQSPNSTNRAKQGQKVVLLVETIAWI
jgi:hypothetical protein